MQIKISKTPCHFVAPVKTGSKLERRPVMVKPRSKWKTVPSFLARGLGRPGKLSVVSRVYSDDPAKVPDRVAAAAEMVRQLRAIRVAGRELFGLIELVVWTSGPGRDCGLTAACLEQALAGTADVQVSEYGRGGQFVSLLNDALARHALDHGYRFSLVLSAEARSYISDETLGDMVAALAEGASVVPLEYGDCAELIAKGFDMNTFNLLNLDDFIRYGMFDSVAEEIGVEEITYALKRCYHRFLWVAPVQPRTAGAYTLIDTSAKGFEHQAAKIKSKLDRAAKIRACYAHLFPGEERTTLLEILAQNVMPGYGWRRNKKVEA